MKTKRSTSSRRSAERRKTYFFSDAHLGLGTAEEDRRRETRLIRFLTSIRRSAAEIYIVGDLFDYWFEYRTVVPKNYYRLFSILRELTDNGIRVSFIAGNHDFWVRDYFRDELGMDVHHDAVETTIRGKRFLIHHGDGLLKDDIGYKILKRILRNPVSIFLFSLVHPDITGRLARWSSKTSRQYTSNRSYEGNGMTEFAARKLRDGFDVVVMGHNHVPSCRKIGRGVYVNLGDWITRNTYAVFDGNRIALKHWTDRDNT